MVVALMLGVLAVAAGCRTPSIFSGKPDPMDAGQHGALTPSDMAAAMVAANKESQAVLIKAIKQELRELPSGLHTVPEGGGFGGAVNARSIPAREADGNIARWPDGSPICVDLWYAVRSNIQEDMLDIKGVDELGLKFGVRPEADETYVAGLYAVTAPVDIFRCNVKRVEGAGWVDEKQSEIIAARAAERDAILSHLPAMIRETYIGRGKVIETTAGGLVKVIKTSGDTAVGVLMALSPTGQVVNGVSEGLRIVIADPTTGVPQVPIDVENPEGD
jgi:hypothetical protein